EDGILVATVTGVQTCALPICTAGTRSCKGRHNGPCSNERSEPWNREGSNANQPPQSAAQQCSGSGAGCGAFWRLSIFLVGKVLRSEERRVGNECQSRSCVEQW